MPFVVVTPAPELMPSPCRLLFQLPLATLLLVGGRGATRAQVRLGARPILRFDHARLVEHESEERLAARSSPAAGVVSLDDERLMTERNASRGDIPPGTISPRT